MQYRSDIDGLRALAILSVVGFHAGVPYVSGGYVGVDVFFVISGFLITAIIDRDLKRGQFSLLVFYERRARRILPALFVVVVACFAAGWLLLLDRQFEGLARSAFSVVGFASNFHFWLEARNYFSASADMQPLLHTWSLAVEEQFYIVFPVLLMMIRTWSDRHRMVILSALALLSLLLSIIAIKLDEAAAFYLMPSRFFELTIGSLLAIGRLSGQGHMRYQGGLAALGMICILGPAVAYDETTDFPGLAALLPALGAALVIHAGTSPKTVVSRLLSCRPVVFIGLISYSLYLWHWPILAFLRVRYDSVALPPSVAAAAVALAFAIAWLSWRFVERPFRDRAMVQPRQILIMATGGASVILGLSLAIWIQSGLPERIPPAARMLAEAKHDTNPRRSKCFQVWPADDLCRLGADRAPISFILWGDSHADAFMPALDLAAKQAGKAGLFVGASACPPLLGVSPVERKRSGCRAFNDEVIAMLGERSEIRHVILAARWAVYAEAAPVLAGSSPVFRLHDDGDAGDNAAVFRRGLARTLDRLQATSKTITILGGVPEIGWDVPTRLAHASWWGDDVPAIPNESDVMARNAHVERAFADLIGARGVRLVPMADLLCRPDCMVAYRGKPLYHDADHISLHAARTVFASALRDRIWGGQGPDFDLSQSQNPE